MKQPEVLKVSHDGKRVKLSMEGRILTFEYIGKEMRLVVRADYTSSVFKPLPRYISDACLRKAWAIFRSYSEREAREKRNFVELCDFFEIMGIKSRKEFIHL